LAVSTVVTSTTSISRPKSLKIWRYRGVEHPTLTPDFLQACDDSRLLASLLKNRGIETAEDARRFLNLADYQPTSGLALPNMQAGLDRMVNAIDAGQNILIYGDFDVDGQTGTSILYAALKHLDANVSFYIPDRVTEGHGMNPTALCRLVSSRQVHLVITTDTGITDFKEVALLTGIGVDCIITDHHDLPENLPLSVANINPKLLDDSHHPLYNLCGAGVAFKFCELLLAQYNQADFAETLYDIAAIGTVVDMMPLVDENRWLVWRGLQTLNQQQRVGITALLEAATIASDSPVTSQTIGFTIGPRLNALGRLDRADEGVELLTTTDPTRAEQLAVKFEALNRRRKTMCEETQQEANQFMARQGGLGEQRAVIMASPQWHPGIVGLVGTRLKDQFNVPIFLMVIDEANRVAKCSARSIEGFHLHDELQKLEHYFLNFGGHAGAAGFALPLEKLDAFKKDLHALCAQVITEDMMRPIIDVDAKVDWHQLTPGLVDIIERLEPTGQANPGVLLSVERVKISAQRFLGEDQKHLKLLLTDPNAKGGQPVEALIWYHPNGKLNADVPLDVVFRPEINVYGGDRKLQLIVEDTLSSDSTVYQSVRDVLPTPPPQNVSPLPKPAVIPGPAPNTVTMEMDIDSVVSWIDHRGRDSLITFTSQLLVPLQQQGMVRLYSEGLVPTIPFLDTSIVVNRQTIVPCDELVFWDFPPEESDLKAILEQAQPKTIHWIGGQFHQHSVFLPARDWLKQIYQAARGLPAEAAVKLLDLAVQLSTTVPVVQSGLTLLAAMQLVQSRPVADSNGSAVTLTLLNANGEKREITDYLEFWLFDHHVTQVANTRDWLIQSPISVIKSKFA